jgi:adenylate cyclase
MVNKHPETVGAASTPALARYAERFRAISYVGSHGSWQGFYAVLKTLVAILRENAIPVDRVQIPFSKMAGFLHPTIQTAILTWTAADDAIELDIVPHNWMQLFPGPDSLQERLKNTPYYAILFEGAHVTHYPLTGDVPENIEILTTLRQRGYVDYFALKLLLPENSIQVVSVATQQVGGFDADRLWQVYAELEPLLALALYAAYQTSVSAEIARTYLGDRTGKRVLQGELLRGVSTSLEAGIMFCDLRGFTRLNQLLGAEKTVEVMNQVFDRIGQVMESSPAEILKFIGDALLIVLPVAEFQNLEQVQTCMLDLARRSHTLVKALGQELALPLAVGFGGHIGKVVYGNVGTSSRLDFTIMGPAVNLAARLEAQCSTLGAFYLVSQQALPVSDALISFGERALKGIDEPVPVWGVLDEEQSPNQA